jgi:hypothetical protein
MSSHSSTIRAAFGSLGHCMQGAVCHQTHASEHRHRHMQHWWPYFTMCALLCVLMYINRCASRPTVLCTWWTGQSVLLCASPPNRCRCTPCAASTLCASFRGRPDMSLYAFTVYISTSQGANHLCVCACVLPAGLPRLSSLTGCWRWTHWHMANTRR